MDQKSVASSCHPGRKRTSDQRVKTSTLKTLIGRSTWSNWNTLPKSLTKQEQNQQCGVPALTQRTTTPKKTKKSTGKNKRRIGYGYSSGRQEVDHSHYEQHTVHRKSEKMPQNISTYREINDDLIQRLAVKIDATLKRP